MNLSYLTGMLMEMKTRMEEDVTLEVKRKRSTRLVTSLTGRVARWNDRMFPT